MSTSKFESESHDWLVSMPNPGCDLVLQFYKIIPCGGVDLEEGARDLPVFFFLF